MVDAFLQYLDMGGYAAFVWPAYGLSAAGLIGILVLTLRTLKARQKEFDALKALRRGDSERN
ncbi:MAG: heme exporter protein CcmD [Rhodospirillaceae bacterium]|nr:heme exporter protein CcmD [Rhodospirillaceae bacterium]